MRVTSNGGMWLGIVEAVVRVVMFLGVGALTTERGIPRTILRMLPRR